MLKISGAEATSQGGHLQHLTLVFVIVGLFGNLGQPMDSLFQSPSGKDVGKRVRSLVCRCPSAARQPCVGLAHVGRAGWSVEVLAVCTGLPSSLISSTPDTRTTRDD